jgi:hypothetical protein
MLSGLISAHKLFSSILALVLFFGLNVPEGSVRHTPLFLVFCSTILTLHPSDVLFIYSMQLARLIAELSLFVLPVQIPHHS